MKFILLIIGYFLFALSCIGQDVGLTCDKVYSTNGAYYYLSNSRLFTKNVNNNPIHLEGYPLVERGQIIETKKWGNLHVINSQTIALRYEKMCSACNDLEYSKKKKSVYFHCRNITKNIKEKHGTLKDPIRIEKRKLDIPTEQFLDSQDDNFNYDFISSKDELYLIIQNHKKLHVYKVADFKNIIANKWVLVKSFDFDFKTEYFTAHYKSEDNIEIYFSTQGIVSINIQKGKYEPIKKKRKKKKKYFLIDVDENYSTKVVSERKLIKLLE